MDSHELIDDTVFIHRFLLGEEQSFNVLVKKYKPLMNKMANKYYLPNMEKEDFIQECCVVMYDAILKYDLQKNVKFSTFYRFLLNNHFKQLLRYHYASKRLGDFLMVNQDDAFYENYTGIRYNQALNPIDVLVVRETFDEAYETLSNQEKKVFYYSQKYPYKCEKKWMNSLYRSKYKIRRYIKSK
ncbi:hypothetical protein GMA11_03850 [Granulicatella sp. zg-ZJ]|uniref:sigma factor n=1 Tax=Granulicatella sp. zg-ZJ TaxID=2678504 RepID=UPI0013D59DE2|nr:sigma factor [Granulicatella sp. zg-ZJ]MBS4750280.1 hypothetical protein [Carnobacteriaceae bacterium zg-ZUI78]NEW62522.1 hypothetical protein [Granulicatella sp. zg-ZJ]